MARQYLRTMLTHDVRAAQRRYYDRSYPDQGTEHTDEALGPNELAFVAERDSFYMATVTEEGWPYLQHRGGPKGFLVANGTTANSLFADYGGNRQLISVGSADKRSSASSLFLMDYAVAHAAQDHGNSAEVLDAREHPEAGRGKSAPPGGHAARPRAHLPHPTCVAGDWNCPKFITERYTREQVDALTKPLRERIAELEARLR